MAKAMGQYEKVLNVLKEANADVSLDTFKQQCEVAASTCTEYQRTCGRLRPQDTVRSYTD